MLKPTKIHNVDDSNYPCRIDGSGQLLIQCGAHGNLQDVITVLERIAHSHQFKAYFIDWKQPWHFAKPDEIDKLLEECIVWIISSIEPRDPREEESFDPELWPDMLFSQDIV